MFTAVLKAHVGRCLRLEVGHELRPTPEVLIGCVAGLYEDDALLALIVSRQMDKPLSAPEPAVSAAPQTASAPVTPPQVITSGQPLPSAPATPPATPAPVQASQSNQQKAKLEYRMEHNIHWIDISKIISVVHDSGVVGLTTRNKWDAKLPPERMYDMLPDPFEQVGPDGQLRMAKVTPEVRKGWHDAVFDHIRKRLAELSSLKVSYDLIAPDPKFEQPEPDPQPAATP